MALFLDMIFLLLQAFSSEVSDFERLLNSISDGTDTGLSSGRSSCNELLVPKEENAGCLEALVYDDILDYWESPSSASWDQCGAGGQAMIGSWSPDMYGDYGQPGLHNGPGCDIVVGATSLSSASTLSSSCTSTSSGSIFEFPDYRSPGKLTVH